MLRICLLVQHKSVVKAWTARRSWAAHSSESVSLLACSGVILVVGNNLWRTDERALGIGDLVTYCDGSAVSGVNDVDKLGSLVVICLRLAVALD